jgi:hypothetical protein
VTLLANWGLVAVLGVPRALQALRRAVATPFGRRALVEGAALFALALLPRALLAPCAPYHGEGPEYAYLDAAFRPFLEQASWPYHGGAGPALYGIAMRLLPFAEHTVYGLNAVLGALSAVLLRDLTARLTAQRTAGLAAGLLFALLPGQVRLACSESLMIPLVFQWLLALALASRLHRGSPWHEWALVAALAISATNTRPCGFLVLPMLAVVAGPRLAERPSRLLWGLPLLAGLVPVLVSVGAEIVTGPSGQSRLANAPLARALFDPATNPWWLPRVTPWLLHPGVQVAGAALLAWRRRWTALVVAAIAVLGSEVLVLSQAVALLNALRFTAPAAPFVALLGGVTIASPTDALRRRLRVPEPALVAALVALGVAVHLPDHLRLVTFEGNLQKEYRFLQRAIPALPNGSLVVSAAGWEADTHYSPAFPTCLAAPLGRHVAYANLSWIRPLGEERAAHPGGVYAFVGLYCWSFPYGSPLLARYPAQAPAPVDADTPLDELLASYTGRAWKHGVADGLQIPACEALRRRFAWTPLAEETVTSAPELWFSVPSPRVTFGLYRLDRETP